MRLQTREMSLPVANREFYSKEDYEMIEVKEREISLQKKNCTGIHFSSWI